MPIWVTLIQFLNQTWQILRDVWLVSSVTTGEAVDVGDYLPAIGLEAAAHIVGVPLLDAALVGVDRYAVVVVDRDQLAQAQRARKRAGLVRYAFHHAAVAEEGVGKVIDDLETGPVEFGSQEFF